MKARLQKAAREILESPVLELDLRELFTSWRTSAILVLLTLLVGIPALVLGVLSQEAPFRALAARFGMGHYLVATGQLGVGLALTLLVPLRTAGLVEGPRWWGYFDQLVTSGIKPSRYYAGRAVAAQGLIALVFLGTAPLLLALGLTDPPPLATVLTNHALLLVYAELLLAVTLGLGTLIHEAPSAFGVMLLGLGFGAAAFFPLPSALVALSPARAIVGPFALEVADVGRTDAEVLYGVPHFFELEVPLPVYATALSLVIGALMASCCVVGRPHAFAPGFNNFGAVVLEGDRRRAAVLRFRPALVRRGELAFLFENEGGAHRSRAPWWRLARAAALLFLLSGTLLAALWNHAFLAIIRGGDQVEYGFVVASFVFATLAVGAPFALATTRTDARLDLELGTRRLPMVVADVLLYVVVAGSLLGLFVAAGEELKTAIVFSPPPGSPFRSIDDVSAAWTEWALVLAVSGLALVLLQKVIGLRMNDPAGAVVLALAVLGSTGGLPAAVGPEDLKQNDVAQARPGDEEPKPPSPERTELTLLTLHLCPIVRLGMIVNPGFLHDVPLPPGESARFLASAGFWVIYPTLEVALFANVLLLVRRRRREARAELEGPLEPPSPEATPASDGATSGDAPGERSS